MRSIDGKLDAQSASMEEAVAKAVEAATADIIARIASLEDTVLTLAEALLRPDRSACLRARQTRKQRPQLKRSRLTPTRWCRAACS